MASYQKEEIEKLLRKGLALLYKNDYFLISHDVNERSISHKLAGYLQTLFPELHVDCEYNKIGKRTIDGKNLSKKMDWSPREQVETDDTNGKTVYPDIIIHTRGIRSQNLLVVEVKKSINRNNEKRTKDYQKLFHFITDSKFKYKYAAFIDLKKRLSLPEFFDSKNEKDKEKLKEKARIN